MTDKLESLKTAIAQAHRTRDIEVQRDEVVEAARALLGALQDGEPMRVIVGAQSRLESAINRYDALVG